MANVYVVSNEEGKVELGNLGKVAKFLGVKKITKADLEAGKYPMVTLEESTEEVEVPVTQLAEVEPTEETEGMEVPDDSTGFLPDAELDQATLDAIAKVEEAISATPEDNVELFDALCNLEDSLRESVPLTEEQGKLMVSILTNTFNPNPVLTDTQEEDIEEGIPVVAPPSDTEYPEVGDFKDEKAIKKFIKSLSPASLEEWCILEGAEWKHTDHESINRMRMAMAIKAIHFPSTAPKASKKSKSKYATYATEDLVQMALDNDVEVPDDKGDMRICRMYTIMALKKAGLLD